MRRIRNSFIAFFLLSFSISPCVKAESPIQAVIEKGKAVVSIQAVEAALFKSGKPQGVFDRATGNILVIQKIHRIAEVQTGGGIIIDSHGLIVTAAHTLKNMQNIIVVLFDGTKLPAKILREIPKHDIAFIKVNPPFPLEKIEFANSDSAPVGMEVYAMGRAQWVNGTLTGGKITGLGIEKIDGIKRATSLRINFKAYKGDSGSPILDGNGHLLGMITAGRTLGSTTYAVSSNMISTAYNNFLDSNR